MTVKTIYLFIYLFIYYFIDIQKFNNLIPSLSIFIPWFAHKATKTLHQLTQNVLHLIELQLDGMGGVGERFMIQYDKLHGNKDTLHSYTLIVSWNKILIVKAALEEERG